MTFDAVNLVYYFTGAVLSAFADYATRGSKRGEKRGREANEPRAGAGPLEKA